MIILNLTIGVNSNAANGEYQCTVVDLVDTDESGRIRARPDLKGKHLKFSVSRSTGVIIGDLFGNTTQIKPPDIRVIEYGDSEQSFKVMTTYKPYISVDYLEVDEFDRSSKKTFRGMARSLMATGVCE